VADGLCLFYADPNGDGGARDCWSIADVRVGRATGELGRHIYGLVPDGVARVRLTYSDGRSQAAGVIDNFFDIAAPADSADPEGDRVPARVASTIWLNEMGFPEGPPSP
jgi:hypothetical protein